MTLPARSNLKFLFVFLLLLLIFVILCPDDGVDKHRSLPTPSGDRVLNKREVLAKAASLSIPFVENIWQFPAEVKFTADLFAGRFFLTEKDLVYSLFGPMDEEPVRRDKRKRNREPEIGMSGKCLAIREFFVDKRGGKIGFVPTGEEKAETKISFFKGSDSAKWRVNIPSYQSISLGWVFPGVEIKLQASGRNVEKIFYVSTSGNVAEIRIGVVGVAGLKIAGDGQLMFLNPLSELAMRAPVAWQEIGGKRRAVKVGYRLLGKQLYGFTVPGKYDKKYPLIIDPDLDTLMTSTFLGGSNSECGISLALDQAGNVYLTGITGSSDFPTMSGAYDQSYDDRNNGYNNQPSDVFVAKMDSNLTTLLASTYLGGSENDRGNSISLDSSGNVYLTGITNSADFPTTPGAYDRSYNGNNNDFYTSPEPGDAFISKLNGNLTELLSSTYLGGVDNDIGSALSLDSTGNAYLVGSTCSKDFPTTPGAYDRSYNGHHIYLPTAYDEVFVSKLDSGLTTLLASTYLGGSENERSSALALDTAGNVYFAGSTGSKNFPTTPGAYDRTVGSPVSGGWNSAFISKLDGNLTTLLASTFLGGFFDDGASSLALDSSGNIYVTGYTDSEDFPTTEGAYDRSYDDSENDYDTWSDVFVSKLNGNLTSLLASSFLGGSERDQGFSLALDSMNNVYLKGFTYSSNFPTTPGAYDRTYKGASGFVSKLNSSLTSLRASTLWSGGGFYIGCNSLALDFSGNVYVTGLTYSKDFPTTNGAYDRKINGGDACISKLNGTMPGITVISPNGGENWTLGSSNAISWRSSGKIVKVNIDYSTNKGSDWTREATHAENDGVYIWNVPDIPSSQCLVKISDSFHAGIKDISNAVFSILMNLDLQAERREIKAFSIMRQYGQIHFLVDDADVPVDQYRVLRRQGNGDFTALKTIAPSELRDNQFEMQDKYLEKDKSYTYVVEAYNAAGQVVGRSAEKTI